MISPENDRNLSTYFVPPVMLEALLNPESTLLAAPAGYGKSTLAFVARQRMQHDWLNINLEEPNSADEDFMTVLLRQITQGMWDFIEANPALLGKLQTRAAAARYFLHRFSDINIDYLLARLADDNPLCAEVIQAFQCVQFRELFNPTATDTQRLSILCDCIQKLEIKGVIVWIDLAHELKHLSLPYLHVLEAFFDSLHLMRQRILHIKCLAPPSVCQHLRTLRGMETLSVNGLTLHWNQDQLMHLIDQRLRQASEQQIHTLAQLIDPKQFMDFLAEFSDSENPLEWIILTSLIVEALNQVDKTPLSEQTWLTVRRLYCAERVKIRLDEQGSFWRGKQLLAELTPKKRAIYPLVKYLYEHPGVHRPYNLRAKLNSLRDKSSDKPTGVDENNLNTIISRARKEHLEPFPPTEAEDEEGWIYLVTELSGSGYALKHTLRSP